MSDPPASSQFMVTLVETGLFDMVKATELVIGALLLLDLFVRAALVMAMPISVVVWYNHAILAGKPFDFSMGVGCLRAFRANAALAYHLHPYSALPPGAGEHDPEAKLYLVPELTARAPLRPNIRSSTFIESSPAALPSIRRSWHPEFSADQVEFLHSATRNPRPIEWKCSPAAPRVLLRMPMRRLP